MIKPTRCGVCGVGEPGLVCVFKQGGTRVLRKKEHPVMGGQAKSPSQLERRAGNAETRATANTVSWAKVLGLGKPNIGQKGRGAWTHSRGEPLLGNPGNTLEAKTSKRGWLHHLETFVNWLKSRGAPPIFTP